MSRRFSAVLFLVLFFASAFAQLPDSLNMRLVGTWEAPVELTSAAGSTPLAVKGNYAYVTSMDTLYMLDISDPTSPTVSQKICDGYFWASIAIGESLLYANGERFRVINLNQNPPSIIGSLAVILGGPVDLSESIEAAFCKTLPIQWIDISIPTSPSLGGEYSEFGHHAVYDSFLYIGEYSSCPYETSGYQVWNISNPDAPAVVSSHCFYIEGDATDTPDAITADEYGAYMHVPAYFAMDFFHFTASGINDTLLGYGQMWYMTTYQNYLIINGLEHGTPRISVYQTFSGDSAKLKGHYRYWTGTTVGTCIDDSLYVVFSGGNFVTIFKVDSVSLQVCELEERYKHDDLRIYPNPLDIGRMAHVNGGNASVYDIRGCKVGEITAEKPLSTESLSPGVYLAVSRDRKSSAKFIVLN